MQIKLSIGIGVESQPSIGIGIGMNSQPVIGIGMKNQAGISISIRVSV